MAKVIETALIVGLGSIGKKHIGIIKSHFPQINIVLLRHKKCNSDDINRLGILECVTSIEKAIEFNPQIAIISNPASKHIEVAKKLAFKGINLLIEKPLSNSVNGVQELIDLCEKNKLKLMTGYNLRYSPSLLNFKKQINLNIIGKIYSVRSEVGQYLPDWRLDIDYKNSVSANKALGGGVLLELSHEIDYLIWIFGEIEWVKSHISKQSDLKLDVEDNAKIIMGLKGSDSSKITASLNLDFYRHDKTRKCFAIGEKGTLFWDGINNQVKLYEKSHDEWRVLFHSKINSNETYVEEIKSFFSAVESNNKTSISGEEGLQVVSIIEKIKQSSETNLTVNC